MSLRRVDDECEPVSGGNGARKGGNPTLASLQKSRQSQGRGKASSKRPPLPLLDLDLLSIRELTLEPRPPSKKGSNPENKVFVIDGDVKFTIDVSIPISQAQAQEWFEQSKKEFKQSESGGGEVVKMFKKITVVDSSGPDVATGRLTWVAIKKVDFDDQLKKNMRLIQAVNEYRVHKYVYETLKDSDDIEYFTRPYNMNDDEIDDVLRAFRNDFATDQPLFGGFPGEIGGPAFKLDLALPPPPAFDLPDSGGRDASNKGEIPTTLYFVQEWASNDDNRSSLTFQDFINKVDKSTPVVYALGQQVGRAVKALHYKAGILHNDISIRNIMVIYTPDNVKPGLVKVKIIDFGLASEMVGTPEDAFAWSVEFVNFLPRLRLFDAKVAEDFEKGLGNTYKPPPPPMQP